MHATTIKSLLRMARKRDCVHAAQGEQAGEEEHLLPDGQRISVRSEGVQLGELLLDPTPLDSGLPSVVDYLINSCTAHSEAGVRKVSHEQAFKF